MTREEALKILDTIPTIGEQVDALEMAIESLQREEAEANGYCHRIRPSNVEVVVRCKDCDRCFGSPVCPIQSQGWAINTDTFFCAWGEDNAKAVMMNEQKGTNA